MQLNILRKSFFSLVLITNSLFYYTQDVSIKLSKTKINIAEPVTLTIKVAPLSGKEVSAAPKNELLPFHFEEIKDSINTKGDEYIRIIDFAIFQEGDFSIPELEIKVGEKVIKTKKLDVHVVNPTQEGETIDDNMPIEQVQLSFVDYLLVYKFYIIAILALIALFFLMRKMKVKGEKPSTNKKFNFEDLLNNLKNKNYIPEGNYRSFYIELIEISRRLLDEKYQIPAIELLTEDLIDVIKNKEELTEENKTDLERILNHGDLVKFAKIIPTQEIMENDLKTMLEFAKQSENKS